MPIVAEEGEFKFIVRTREYPFEPPHVHVRYAEGKDVRINLENGSLMDRPPRGKAGAIRRAYRKHAAVIREKWEEYHGNR